MLVLNTSPVARDARVLKEARSVAREHEVVLVALSQPDDPTPMAPGVDFRLFRLLTRTLRGPWTWPLKYGEFAARAAWRLIRTQADVYHAHDLDALLIAFVVARLRRVPVVYDAHELYAERPIPLRRVWLAIDRALTPRVDRVITANEERADVMLREYGAKRRPLPLLNCPSTAVSVPATTVRQRLPQQLRNRFVVLYQGGLAPGRGLARLVEALALCEPDVLLVLLGDRNAYTNTVLTDVIHREGVVDRVRFMDPVPQQDLTGFVRDADVGVVIYERVSRNNWLCAPNKLFEYCAAGLPVIGCAFPPVLRVMKEYPIGRSFDPHDASTIAAAIADLRRDTKVMAAARTAALAAARRYTWEAEEQKLLHLYRELRGEIRRWQRTRTNGTR